jgi:translation initiation factor IF-2
LALLSKEFADSALDKEEASSLSIGIKHSENVIINAESETDSYQDEDEKEILIKGSQYNQKSESFTSTDSKNAESKSDTGYASDKPKLQGFKVVGKIDLDKKPTHQPVEKPVEEPKTVEPSVVEPTPVEEPEEKKTEELPVEPVKIPEVPKPPFKEQVPVIIEKKKEDEVIEARAETLQGLKVLGKIELPKKVEKPVASSDDSKDKKKKKRPRKRLQREDAPVENQRPASPAPGQTTTRSPGLKRGKDNRQRPVKEEPSEKEIQEQIKATLAKLSGQGKLGAMSAIKISQREAFCCS